MFGLSPQQKCRRPRATPRHARHGRSWCRAPARRRPARGRSRYVPPSTGSHVPRRPHPPPSPPRARLGAGGSSLRETRRPPARPPRRVRPARTASPSGRRRRLARVLTTGTPRPRLARTPPPPQPRLRLARVPGGGGGAGPDAAGGDHGHRPGVGVRAGPGRVLRQAAGGDERRQHDRKVRRVGDVHPVRSLHQGLRRGGVHRPEERPADGRLHQVRHRLEPPGTRAGGPGEGRGGEWAREGPGAPPAGGDPSRGGGGGRRRR